MSYPPQHDSTLPSLHDPFGFAHQNSYVNAGATEPYQWSLAPHQSQPDSASSQSSCDSSPSTKELDLSTVPSQTSSGGRRRSPDYIPRPRNAFMIFRSAFLAERRIGTEVEHDHRLISRIIAHCWNNMDDAEKETWKAKAKAEKAEHARKYPGYRYNPKPRRGSNVPVKRKVKRNGKEDLDRCAQLAELIQAGKKGKDLANAAKQLGLGSVAGTAIERQSDIATSTVASAEPLESAPKSPVFRNPLLPPTQVQSTSDCPSPAIESSYTTPVAPGLFQSIQSTPTDNVASYLSSHSQTIDESPTATMYNFDLHINAHYAERSVSSTQSSYTPAFNLEPAPLYSTYSHQSHYPSIPGGVDVYSATGHYNSSSPDDFGNLQLTYLSQGLDQPVYPSYEPSQEEDMIFSTMPLCVREFRGVPGELTWSLSQWRLAYPGMFPPDCDNWTMEDWMRVYPDLVKFY